MDLERALDGPRSVFHEDDDEDARSRDSAASSARASGDDEDAAPKRRAPAPTRLPIDPLAARPGHSGGGPKAVLADARWARRRVAIEAERGELEAREARRAAGGRDDDDGDVAPAGEPDSLHPSMSADAAAVDDDSDDGYGDFMARYRATRIAEFRVSLGLPTYGTVVEAADAAAFGDAIDAADPRAFVAALLYETFLPEARHARAALDGVARAHPRLLCVAARGGAVSRGLDVIALPALLVYRGGALHSSVLRVHECAAGGSVASAGSRSSAVSAADLESVLAAKGAL